MSDGKQSKLEALQEAVISLTLRNLSLEKSLARTREERDLSKQEVDRLQQDLPQAIAFTAIANKIKQNFTSGVIPAPEEILCLGKPYVVECGPGDIYLSHKGINVKVHFEADSYSVTESFLLCPVPADGNRGYYPNFQEMIYDKPKIPKKRAPRKNLIQGASKEKS